MWPRIGGDEFVVLHPGVGNHEEAAQIGKLITDVLDRPIGFEGADLKIGASLGIAVYPLDGESAELLLKAANENMYRDKASRKVRSS